MLARLGQPPLTIGWPPVRHAHATWRRSDNQEGPGPSYVRNASRAVCAPMSIAPLDRWAVSPGEPEYWGGRGDRLPVACGGMCPQHHTSSVERQPIGSLSRHSHEAFRFGGRARWGLADGHATRALPRGVAGGAVRARSGGPGTLTPRALPTDTPVDACASLAEGAERP